MNIKVVYHVKIPGLTFLPKAERVLATRVAEAQTSFGSTFSMVSKILKNCKCKRTKEKGMIFFLCKSMERN